MTDHHFIKNPTYNARGIKRGDRVRVNGHRGHFTFIAYVESTDRRRSPWVDVTEKRTGATRSFPAKIVRRAR